MKKLLAFLLSANLVAVSATSLVACQFYKLDPHIWLITDGGFINDKSFKREYFLMGPVITLKGSTTVMTFRLTTSNPIFVKWVPRYHFELPDKVGRKLFYYPVLLSPLT